MRADVRRCRGIGAICRRCSLALFSAPAGRRRRRSIRHPDQAPPAPPSAAALLLAYCRHPVQPAPWPLTGPRRPTGFEPRAGGEVVSGAPDRHGLWVFGNDAVDERYFIAGSYYLYGERKMSGLNVAGELSCRSRTSASRGRADGGSQALAGWRSLLAR
jgi:hypothetical protein